MKVLSGDKKRLLTRVGELIDQSQGADFVIFEDTGHFSLGDDLVKKVRILMRDTAELLLEIMELYDSEAESDEAEISADDDELFLKEIGAQIASQMAVEQVSGLAFVSRGQLLDTLMAIDNALVEKKIWKVASHTDTGLRRAGRALVAIESAMREYEGLPAEFRQWQNLDDSLEVRRLYGEFRRAILALDEKDGDRAPSGEELRRTLMGAAEKITKLRGLDIYPYLRIDDRLQIRRLQKRILEWLEKKGASAETGSQLWGDLVAFARLLAEVNHRQEIREHDRIAVDGFFRRFFAAGKMPGKLTSDQLALLEPLLGREEELDRILLNPDRHSGHHLKAPLERLRKELGIISPDQPANSG